MRKYDIKNKRNIGIIIGISIIIIIMFSLVIKLFLSSDKKEYTVHDGALVFDKDKSIIKVTEDSTIKKKWNNEYYLKFKDNNYELGNTAISYNEKTGEIILYGKYYEIGSGDLIDVTDGETVIKSSVITKFYKLADRKYLVVDKDIKTSDGLLSTNEFLMIDLDKVGNATLVNHKVNLKAFAATSIVTSNYTFDIANEILTYGSNKIDLKKIIGSSNTYTKEDLIPEENDNSSSNDGVTNITDNTTGGNGTNGGNDATGDNKGTDDGKNNNSGNVIEEIKKATKRTSVISVTSSVSKIIVDYVVYDPYNEYTNVYMEVEEAGSNKINTIYLNKNDTRYEFTNIFPNTNYRIKFKYSYIEDGVYLLPGEVAEQIDTDGMFKQLDLFTMFSEQVGNIAMKQAEEKSVLPKGFVLPEKQIDDILRSGGGRDDSRKRIYAKYQQRKTPEEMTAFLKGSVTTNG